MGGWPTEPSDYGVTFSPHPLKTSFFQVVSPGVLPTRISSWSDFSLPPLQPYQYPYPPLFLFFSFFRSLALLFLSFPIRSNCMVSFLDEKLFTHSLCPFFLFLHPSPHITLCLKGEDTCAGIKKRALNGESIIQFERLVRQHLLKRSSITLVGWTRKIPCCAQSGVALYSAVQH